MGCGASVVADNTVSNDEAGQSVHSLNTDKPSNQPKLQKRASTFWIGRTKSSKASNEQLQEVIPIRLQRKPEPDIPEHYKNLRNEHGHFLVTCVAIVERSQCGASQYKKRLNKLQIHSLDRPKIDMFQAKTHWIDNLLVRRVSDEILHLEDPKHPVPHLPGKTFMRTLQMEVGRQVHVFRMANNPDVTIGGYFIISQMLSYSKVLVSLDVSSNNLTAAEARILALGLQKNYSLQELRMKDNTIGTEGAQALAEMLKTNDTLLLIDLRMNSIRGNGLCALADAMSENYSMTSLDIRWNYSGECSDYVEKALVDLKDFCYRNILDHPAMLKPPEGAIPQTPESSNSNHSPESVASSFFSSPESSPSQSLNRHPDHPAKYMSIVERAIGMLEVTVISAKNLPQVIWTAGKDSEFLGMPQAYCTLILNNQKTTTKIMKKSWAPVWKHKVRMEVHHVWQIYTLRVMHSKYTKKTNFDDYAIGNVIMPVCSVINWHGVTQGHDHTWRAFHRPHKAPAGAVFRACTLKQDAEGNTIDIFEDSEQAAQAYDETARKLDEGRATLNFSCPYDNVGKHVKDNVFSLVADDGVPVTGVQTGVDSCVRLCLKYFDYCCHYLEIHVDKCTNLPKMDSGFGLCDAYCHVLVGHYHFRTRVVKNSLDPEFLQTFRITVPDTMAPVSVKVQVFDWDMWNEDDHMGDADFVINLEDLSGRRDLPGCKAGGQTEAQCYEIKQPDQTNSLTNAKGEKSMVTVRFTLTNAEQEDFPHL